MSQSFQKKLTICFLSKLREGKQEKKAALFRIYNKRRPGGKVNHITKVLRLFVISLLHPKILLLSAKKGIN